MTAQTKTTLKGYFNTNDAPTEAQFTNLIDTIGVNGLLVAANDASDAAKGRADYVCDGTADDVQIQAAIDALTSGGRVVLSEGTFNYAATVTDNNVNSVAIEGQGDSTILRLPNGANAGGAIIMFNLSSVDNWALRNFRIDGNKANNTKDDASRGIVLTTCNDCLIENVTIDDCPATAIRLVTSSRNTLTNCRVDSSTDHGINITSSSHDNYLFGGFIRSWEEDQGLGIRFGCDRNKVIGLSIYDPPTTSGCLQIQTSATACRDNIIANCIIDGNETTPDSRTVSGIFITSDNDAIGTVLSGNIIINCRWGVVSQSGVTDGMVSFTGNTVRDCDMGMDLQAGTQQWLISNNLFQNMLGTAGDGYAINGADHCIIRGNYMTNCAAHGIDVDGDQNIITDNKIDTVIHAINIRSGADNNLVTGNDVTGESIDDSGAGNTIRQNIGYVTENEGAAAAVADGGTIAHGLGATPIVAVCSPSVASEMVSVTTLDGTNITVAIKQDDGTAGTSQTIYWRAYV